MIYCCANLTAVRLVGRVPLAGLRIDEICGCCTQSEVPPGCCDYQNCCFVITVKNYAQRTSPSSSPRTHHRHVMMDIQGTPDWSAGCVLYQALAPIGPFSHACCADTDVSQDAPDWFKIKHSRVAKRPMSPNERVCRLPAYVNSGADADLHDRFFRYLLGERLSALPRASCSTPKHLLGLLGAGESSARMYDGAQR